MNIKNSSSLPTDLSKNTELLTNLIEEAKITVKELLQNLATNPDFNTTPQTAFGLNIQTNSLRESWKAGEFVFPEIEIVNRSEINNANGAFARDTNKIYLAQEFLLGNINNLDAISSVLTEEYGHFIDSQLNIIDAPGDEGAIFAALVRGEELSESELQELRDEDDLAVVVLDGEKIEIETNLFSNDGNYAVYLDENRIFIKDFQANQNINTYYDIDDYKENTLNISADGKYIVFVSDANLIPKVTSSFPWDNVYVYNRETEKLDVIFSELYDLIWIDYTSVSADGKYVVYGAEDWHINKNFDYVYDDYLVDLVTRERKIIPNANNSVISENGSFIAYENDTGVYIYELKTETSQKINDFGNKPVISSKGNYILYFDTKKLYLYNQSTEQTEQINFNSEGVEVDVLINDDSTSSLYNLYSISSNEKYVVFKDDDNFYIRDIEKKITKELDDDIVSYLAKDLELPWSSYYDAYLKLSSDGKYLYYSPNANYFENQSIKKIDTTLPESELQKTVVGFSAANFVVSEDGVSNNPIIVERFSGNLSKEISLIIEPTFSSVNASVTFSENINGDYISFQKQVNIPPYVNSIEVYIDFAIIDDTRLETDETFIVELKQPSTNNNFAVVENNNFANITIKDNDTYKFFENYINIKKTHTGFIAQFDSDIDLNSIDIFNQKANLILKNQDNSKITGSFVWDKKSRKLSFVKTGSVLQNDTYNIQLLNKDSEFKNKESENSKKLSISLETSDFEENHFAGRILSISDLTLASGKTATIPITLDNSEAITKAEFSLYYDADLLDITSVTASGNLPADWKVIEKEIDRDNGRINVTLEGTDALTGSNFNLANLEAVVPDSASYGETQVLDLENIILNDGSISAIADDSIHQVMHSGDVTGDGKLSNEDASQMMRVAVGLDDGFESFSTIDPVIAGDINGDGVISAFDAYLAIN